MTDGKSPEGEKTLHASGPKTLSVKRPDMGVVRQAFSHGRSKAVVVETKRAPVRGGSPLKTVTTKVAEAPKAEAAPATPAKAVKPPPVQPKSGGMVLRTLTEGEKEARSRALTDARVAEEEERRKVQEEAKRRAEEEVRLAREREAAAKRKLEEDARRVLEEGTRRKTDDEPRRSTSDDRPMAAATPRTSARPTSGAPGGYNRAQPGGAPAARAPGAARPAPGGATGIGLPPRRMTGSEEDEAGRVARRRMGPPGPGGAGAF
ncbi:MAG: translation initiation factor IF-2 associated domain-containing protein [Micropepsaceae bacterium]